MIIVSQDRDRIVNFDNVENIDIIADLVYFETTSCARRELGYYKTEKRAKEVLQEIINIYLDCDEYSYAAGYRYVKNSVYYMPED